MNKGLDSRIESLKKGFKRIDVCKRMCLQMVCTPGLVKAAH